MFLFVLSQTDIGAPPPEIEIFEPLPWYAYWGPLFGWGLYMLFLVWMLVYCIRNDPERFIWLWILLLLQPVGAFIYFLARWLPGRRAGSPSFLRRWTRRGAVRRLELAAAQIGNAHQYVQLGEALREVGRKQAALDAFARALKKEPDNLAALWGASNLEFQKGEYQAAREKLEKILAADPAYKFGDVSLLYAKTLYALNETDAARQHLTGHVRKWRQPEALYLLAKICAEQNDPAEARTKLKELIVDVDASPKAIARKFHFWKGRAKRLLRRLPK